MRIIVINLARAADRRRKMEAQLKALGLSFEILEATDGRTLNDADRAWVDHDRRRTVTPYPLTDNEIGCWLSHRRAMQSIIDGTDAMAAVIEDDALLAAEFPQALDAIEALPQPFDVIDLHRNFKRNEIFVPSYPLLTNLSMGRVGYTHMNTIGYVASKTGAHKFLTYAKRFVHAVDKEMHRYWANGLDLYGLEKPIVTHFDEGVSFIDETRGQDRPKERETYPAAHAPYWRVRRSLTRVQDSIQKRRAFKALINRPKNPLAQ